MREQMKILAQLQDFDKEIQKLEEGIAIIPEQVIALREVIGEGDKSADDIKEKLEGLEKKRRHKERELEAKEETLGKYQSQLYEVKTNKEYSALMVEIDSLKQENSELESEILSLMERGDSLRELVEKKKEELSEKKGKLAEEERKNRERISVLEEKLRKRQEERGGLTESIERSLLTHYEKIRKGKGGLALVAVRDEACQGCFTELPPQVINEIMQARRMVTCERCSRMLYLPDDEEDTDKET